MKTQLTHQGSSYMAGGIFWHIFTRDNSGQCLVVWNEGVWTADYANIEAYLNDEGGNVELAESNDYVEFDIEADGQRENAEIDGYNVTLWEANNTLEVIVGGQVKTVEFRAVKTLGTNPQEKLIAKIVEMTLNAITPEEHQRIIDGEVIGDVADDGFIYTEAWESITGLEYDPSGATELVLSISLDYAVDVSHDEIRSLEPCIESEGK